MQHLQLYGSPSAVSTAWPAQPLSSAMLCSRFEKIKINALEQRSQPNAVRAAQNSTTSPSVIVPLASAELLPAARRTT